MSKRRLLFVDDDNNVLLSLKRNLYGMKNVWDMDFVRGGDDAFAKLAERPYDIIIADYMMPGVNGLDLLNTVKEKYPKTKRVLLSGQSEKDVFEEARDIVHHYIAKPCDTKTLISILQSL